MNRWALLGSLTLLLGALGHLLIVDLSLILFKADFVRQNPEAFTDQMSFALVDWGWMGNNKMLNIFSGFSLWVPISLTVIALYNLVIFRHLPPGHPLRRISLVLGLITSIVFLVIAILCFMYPPVLGGILAVLFFALGIKKEKEFGSPA